MSTLIGAVLLNYNSSDRTISHISLLNSFNLFSSIIVVDNCSNSDERKKIIEAKENNNFNLILSEKNLGYGGGNNLGLRYLYEKKYKYVLLLNSDTAITKKTIIDYIKFLDTHSQCAMVASTMIERGNVKRNFFDFPNLKNSFFDSITIERRKNTPNLLSNGIEEKKKLFKTLSKKCHSAKFYDNYLTADFIHESATLYRLDAFHKINFFDEDFFLYEEGPSICMNLKKKNYYPAIILNTEPYVHNHQGTLFNRKTFAAIKKSRMHFFDKYLHYPKWKILLIKIFYINVYLK